MESDESPQGLYRVVNVSALLLTLVLMAATVEAIKVTGWSRPFVLIAVTVAVMIYLPLSWAVCSSALSAAHRLTGVNTDG